MNTAAPAAPAAPGDNGPPLGAKASSDNCYSPDASAQMERLVADFGRMYRERNEALQEVARAHHDALLRLSRAAEFRAGGNGRHLVRVGFAAAALARRLGQTAQYAAQLRQAAPLHDVGKIGVPDSVLNAAEPLAPAVQAQLDEHTRIGAEILGRSRIALFQLAAETALSHHERWDGRGTPHGLAGEAIPLSGRIVAVVDFFDALTLGRGVKPAISDENALLLLHAERGGAFDPRIVDAFVAHAGEFIALRDELVRTEPGFEELSGLADPVARKAR